MSKKINKFNFSKSSEFIELFDHWAELEVLKYLPSFPYCVLLKWSLVPLDSRVCITAMMSSIKVNKVSQLVGSNIV